MASPCCGGPRSSPPSRPRAARWRWRAPTARPPPRRCWPWCCAPPACDPSFIIGGDVTELGTGAAWDDGELFVVEADESDGTFLELGAGGRGRHQRRSRPPRALRRLRRAAGRVRPVPRRGTGSPGRVRRRPLGAAPRPRPSTPSTYGTDESADYRMVDVAAGRDGSRWSIEHGRRALGDLPPPGGRAAQRPQRHRRRRDRPRARRPVRRRGLRRSTGFGGVARRFEVRGEAGGVTFVDDYAHLPTEVARRAPGGAGSGDWDGSSCVFQPHRYSRTAALWHEFADAFDDADVLAVTDVYPAGEAPRPGHHRQARRSMPCSTSDPRRRARLAPDPRRPRGLPGRRAAARRPLPDAGRRRPDDAARRADRRHRPAGHGLVMTTSRPRRRSRRRRCRARRPRRGRRRRSARSPPTGSADRPPCSRPSTTTTQLVALAAGRGRGRACRSWWWGRARTCSWPTAASPAWPSASVSGFADIDVDGTDGACRRRGQPAGRGPPDRRGRPHRLRVGRRRARLDRRRGADERRRARVGHGGVAA